MDAKQAMMRVDEMMGEFSGEVQKVAFCRQMIEDVVNGDGEFDRQGEKTTMMGLAYILSDLEQSHDKLRDGIQGLFNETQTEKGV